MWTLFSISSSLIAFCLVAVPTATEAFAFTTTTTVGPTRTSPSIHNNNINSNIRKTAAALVVKLNVHRFNSGYDPEMGVMWNPMQAAEFVIWHTGAYGDAGMQLAPMIKSWSGNDLGEFLTRLYLGQVEAEQQQQVQGQGQVQKAKSNVSASDQRKMETTTAQDEQNFKVAFESKNVRDPQWKGLEEEGLQALKALLHTALPKHVLMPQEMARCAESFLIKTHTWPSPQPDNPMHKESDSFASRGHGVGIAQVLGSIRLDRDIGRAFSTFSVDEVIEMVTLPEHDDKAKGFLELADFYTNIGIQLTPSERVTIVQGLAQGGWGPAGIAKFVATIKEAPEETEEEEEEEEKVTIPESTESLYEAPAADMGTTTNEQTNGQDPSTPSTDQTKNKVEPPPPLSEEQQKAAFVGFKSYAPK